MTIAERIRRRRLPPPAVARAIREAAGVSQAELAAELGVHRITLARWECGDHQPRSTAAERYAEALAELQEVSR